jgi:HSP20 family protein
MSIMRWDPFEEVGTLRRAMNRLFEDFLFSGRRPPRELAVRGLGPMAWEQPVELYETDDEVVVRAEMPNIDPRA